MPSVRLSIVACAVLLLTAGSSGCAYESDEGTPASLGAQSTALVSATSTAPPVLQRMSPDVGDIYGGAILSLEATGTVTAVTVGGIGCKLLTTRGNNVTCIAPPLPAGLYDVTANSPYGRSTLSRAYEAWHPTLDYPDARVFQSDRGVAAASLASRHRSGRMVESMRPGFIPRDGAGLVRLANGRLLMIGGWAGAIQSAWADSAVTNEVLYSDDAGYSWHVLLPHDPNPPKTGPGARFKPGHTAGVLIHTDERGPNVYWIGSDANAIDRDGSVWRSWDGQTWSLVSTTAPTAGKSLFMVASHANGLFVMGGQTDLQDPATALSTVYRSKDGGRTWKRLADAPWRPRGAVDHPVVFADALWLAGGATYSPAPEQRTYYNDVWRFDGEVWTQVLADGHAQWAARHYHSMLVHEGKLWLLNGFNSSGDLGDAFSSTDGSRWNAVTPVPSWPPSHAQSALSVGGAIVITHGIQSPSLFKLEEHTGPLASSWLDEGAARLALTQANDDAKLIVDRDAFGTQPGLVATGSQEMLLDQIDRNIAGGVYEAWVVGKTLSTSLVPAYATVNPPSPVIGTKSLSAYNEFGFDGGALEYHDGAIAWMNVERGSDFADDRPRLLGVEHRAGSIQLFDGIAPIGEPHTVGVGFDERWTGWEGIAVGYTNGGSDHGSFVYGAFTVLKTDAPSSPAFRAKLKQWGQKWRTVN